MTTRQKVTTGIFLIIILVLIWQVYKMFLASGTTPAPVTPVASGSNQPTQNGAAPASSAPVTPPSATPQQVQLIKSEPVLTAQDQALLKLQQETQAKYLSAVSELQMLKVARDIAETDQAIMSARLSTVTSQKKIVDLLAPPAPPAPIPQVNPNPIPLSAMQQRALAEQQQQQQNQAVEYSVVSVAQIQYQWSAVLGAKGVLYNVRIGDVIPLDNSRVIHIDRSGVIIQKKNGSRKRLSLVPII